MSAGVASYHEFNRERWKEIEDDPVLASLEHRIETNEFGQIVLMPPPGFNHSDLQGLIIEKLLELKPPGGRVRPECPLSTSGGVKGIDIVWLSDERLEEGLQDNILTVAPEICIEVLSPRNLKGEIDEKTALYFEASATEVWICGLSGEMTFFDESGKIESSKLCPDFPPNIGQPG